MCVRLKQWPIDRLRRRLLRQHERGDCQLSVVSCQSTASSRRPERSEGSPCVAAEEILRCAQDDGYSRQLSRQPQSTDYGQLTTDKKSLALVQTIASRQIIVAACEAARARGVRPGITLAEARALCPGLAHDDSSPDKDLKSLESLARWMARFSPAVAVEPPDALMLDVTGSERLFRGMDRLARLASEALTRLNIGHGIAIAPTPGAAWALASFGRGGVFSPDQVPDALAPLPVEALRLEAGLADAFRALGVETVGQLMRLPRESLPARFGLSVLTRLDQALGRSPEPLVPVVYSEPIVARFDFDGVVIDSLETIWLVFQRLLAEVLAELRRRGCGARKLFADYLLPRAVPVRKTILLSRPTCDASSLFNLLRCATETVKQGDGFAGLRLSVPVFERLTHEQLHLLDHESQAAENEMGHLIERLRVRLGHGAVLFAKLVESHLPEKAFRYAEAESVPRKAVSNAPAGFLRFYPVGSALRTDSPGWEITVRNADPTEANPPVGKSLFPLPRYSGGGLGRGFAQTVPAEITPSPALPRSTGGGRIAPRSPTIEVVSNSAASAPPRPRPLHLLPTPVEVPCTALSGEFEGVPVSFTYEADMFQVARAAGPERISGIWWEGRHKTRDYFDVEDTTGRRFWMFQVAETRKWYLHGVFDG
jgi:protein ImuB